MGALAGALRQGTQALHTTVERSHYMRTLLRGQMPRAGYLLLLRNLHPLYEALEAALQTHRNHPLLQALHDPRLARSATLTQDLEALHGTGWPAAYPVQAATTAYVQRLQTLARETPELLVAHAYVRYLGDLSGGQQLQRIVARSLQLPDDGTGTRFYDFGEAAQAQALRTRFREGLDSVAPEAALVERIVAEAQNAFLRHQQLFEELATAAALAPDSRSVTDA